MTASQLREKWIKFFESKSHLNVSNRSVIPPPEDKSLLFINSGIAAIKSYFSGDQEPPAKRLVSAQKVIRTGDIDAIGSSLKHHTYFEMLGNFSIGDYFKEEAIAWAWEFLTKELKLDPERLYITVFKKDSASIIEWNRLLPRERIIALGRDTNFWDMGVGPCGPCSEIYYDRGEKYDDKKLGVKLIKENIENNRFVEIWNIVFSEFLSVNGKINPNPLKNIDTGAGLERLLAVLENKDSNFQTSLFSPIVDFLKEHFPHKEDHAIYAVADYFRAACILIRDGISFGNKGREYILRKVFRKAIFGLSVEKVNLGLLYALCAKVAESLPWYEWKSRQIAEIMNIEHELLLHTVQVSSSFLDEIVAKYPDKVPAVEVFNLVTRYGLDYAYVSMVLTQENRKFSEKQYEKLMSKHKQVSINKNITSAFIQKVPSLMELDVKCEMDYFSDRLESQIVALFDSEFKRTDKINKGYMVLDKTVIFPVSAGQNSDAGWIDGMEVRESLKGPNGQILHSFTGALYSEGDWVSVHVDRKKRIGLEIHHTLEHLLFELLRREVDTAIARYSGFKCSEYFTLDIEVPSHIFPESFNVLALNDALLNFVVQQLPVYATYVTLDQAKRMGLVQKFEEVYQKSKDNLRIIHIGDYSRELCSGTHVINTAQIEDVQIVEFKRKQNNIFRFKVVGGRENVATYLIKRKINRDFLFLANKTDFDKEQKEKFLLEKTDLLERITFDERKFVFVKAKVSNRLAFSVFKDLRGRLNSQIVFLFFKDESNIYKFFVTSDFLNLNELFEILRKKGCKCGGREGLGSGMYVGKDFVSDIMDLLQQDLNLEA